MTGQYEKPDSFVITNLFRRVPVLATERSWRGHEETPQCDEPDSQQRHDEGYLVDRSHHWGLGRDRPAYADELLCST